MELKEKTFIIIGGGRGGGIGYSLVNELLKSNVQKIAVFDIVDSTELKKLSPSIIFRKVDVRNKNEIKNAFDNIFKHFGVIDVLVNCAGILKEPSVEDTMNINLFGVIYATQVGIEYMSVENGNRGGHIMNVSSIAGLDGYFNGPIYSASKHGVIGYTRSLAKKQLESIFGIKFITICPGCTITQLINSMENNVLREDLKHEDDLMWNEMKKQSAEECAKSMLYALNHSENGSVWILDGGECKLAELPKIFS